MGSDSEQQQSSSRQWREGKRSSVGVTSFPRRDSTRGAVSTHNATGRAGRPEKPLVRHGLATPPRRTASNAATLSISDTSLYYSPIHCAEHAEHVECATGRLTLGYIRRMGCVHVCVRHCGSPIRVVLPLAIIRPGTWKCCTCSAPSLSSCFLPRSTAAAALQHVASAH